MMPKNTVLLCLILGLCGFISANGAASVGHIHVLQPSILPAANITTLLDPPPDPFGETVFASDLLTAATAALLQPFEQDVTLSSLSFKFEEAEDGSSSSSSGGGGGGTSAVQLKGGGRHKQKPKYRVYNKEGHGGKQEYTKDSKHPKQRRVYPDRPKHDHEKYEKKHDKYDKHDKAHDMTVLFGVKLILSEEGDICPKWHHGAHELKHWSVTFMEGLMVKSRCPDADGKGKLLHVKCDPMCNTTVTVIVKMDDLCMSCLKDFYHLITQYPDLCDRFGLECDMRGIQDVYVTNLSHLLPEHDEDEDHPHGEHPSRPPYKKPRHEPKDRDQPEDDDEEEYSYDYLKPHVKKHNKALTGGKPHTPGRDEIKGGNDTGRQQAHGKPNKPQEQKHRATPPSNVDDAKPRRHSLRHAGKSGAHDIQIRPTTVEASAAQLPEILDNLEILTAAATNVTRRLQSLQHSPATLKQQQKIGANNNTERALAAASAAAAAAAAAAKAAAAEAQSPAYGDEVVELAALATAEATTAPSAPQAAAAAQPQPLRQQQQQQQQQLHAVSPAGAVDGSSQHAAVLRQAWGDLVSLMHTS